jgi:hypothetical protein
MSELSKNQLTQENNNSFPNNNTGYITPTLLRTFNQNMIDSLVDEQQYNVDSASFNMRINVLDPSGSAQAIGSLEQTSASLNLYTASQNSFNSSATASIVALQNFSSSLDTTFATDVELSASVSALSASVAVTDLAQSSSIAALQQFSSSLDATYATDAELSASASTLQDNINTLSSSVAVTTLGLSSSVAALQQFSSSLDSTFATDAQLSASASTLQNDINTRLLTSSFQSYTQSISTQIAGLGQVIATKLNTSSFNSYTQSVVNPLIAATASYAQTTYVVSVSESIAATDFTQSQQIAALQGVSGSYATTGSNTFNGNQIISGNLNIAGNITAVSASFTYVTTIFETASVIFSSGSNQLGDELTDVQTLSGSVEVEGALFVNGVHVQTSSFDASGYLLTSSFNQYTESAASNTSASINSATQSLSSSIAVTTNNLDLEVNGKLDSGSFNAYTESNDTKVNALIAQTGSYAISSSVASAINSLSASVDLTYATKTELSASASILQNGINSKVENSTFNSYTQSQTAINQALTAQIATRLTTASFNSYTSSNDSKVNSLIAATGSYITSAQTSSMSVLSSSYAVTASYALNSTPIDSGSFVTTSSFNSYTQSASDNVSASINEATQSLSSSIAVTTNGLDLEVNGKLDSSSFNSYTQSNDSVVNALVAATSSYVTEAETGSFITSAQTSSMSVLSSSYSETASFALNVTPTDVSPFLSASTFNAYTQSNDSKVNSLIEKTGSYATTGSNTFIGNQIISGNLNISGSITATSGTFQYVETVFETASTIYSSGSNQFGDDSDDVQTLYGSVRVINALTASKLEVNGVTDLNGVLDVSNDATFRGDVLIQSSGEQKLKMRSTSGGGVSQGFDLLIETSSFIIRDETHDIDFFDFDYNSENTDHTLKLEANRFELNSGSLGVSGSFTASLAEGYVWVGGVGNVSTAISTASLATDTGAYLTTASFNSYTSSESSNVSASINSATSSLSASLTLTDNEKLTTSSFNSYTASESLNVSASINSATSSLSASLTLTDNSKLNTGSFNTYTSSIATQISGLGTAIAGKVSLNSPTNPQTITGSLIISGSSTNGGGETLRLLGGPNPATDLALHVLSGSVEITTPQGNGAHFYSNAPITSSNLRINGTAVIKDLFVSGTWGGTGSGSLFVENSITASVISASQYIGIIESASYAVTASFALNAGASVDTGSFATTGSNRFIGNQTITGSVILSSSADIELTVIGNTIVSGNLVVTGSNINLEVDAPALSIGVTNVKTLLDATASGVITSEDIYRTGAGPTGDLSGVRLQTLSGSDTTGDTLLSRISTGVNRHTSTQMTGSVVNTTILSQWATGSAGGRVTYGSTITANAQSASATITLSAGNGAANFAGGTASLQAGRVNIGTTGATITSTGSWTHNGSFVTSQGITSNNGGITATSGSINGEFRVNGSINITGSNPTIQSGSLSGSLVSTLGDTYTSTPQGNFIVTIDSASMATLLSGATANANTLYFVI